MLRFVWNVCLVCLAAYVLDSNSLLASYTASDHSIHLHRTETLLFAKTRLPVLIRHLYSPKKKHQVHYDGVEIHCVLNIACVFKSRIS